MQLNKYRHYKGNVYEVIGVAHHSETTEELVIYRSGSDKNSLWARPKKMFFENVVIDGKEVPRFTKI